MSRSPYSPLLRCMLILSMACALNHCRDAKSRTSAVNGVGDDDFSLVQHDAVAGEMRTTIVSSVASAIDRYRLQKRWSVTLSAVDLQSGQGRHQDFYMTAVDRLVTSLVFRSGTIDPADPSAAKSDVPKEHQVREWYLNTTANEITYRDGSKQDPDVTFKDVETLQKILSGFDDPRIAAMLQDISQFSVAKKASAKVTTSVNGDAMILLKGAAIVSPNTVFERLGDHRSSTLWSPFGSTKVTVTGGRADWGNYRAFIIVEDYGWNLQLRGSTTYELNSSGHALTLHEKVSSKTYTTVNSTHWVLQLLRDGATASKEVWAWHDMTYPVSEDQAAQTRLVEEVLPRLKYLLAETETPDYSHDGLLSLIDNYLIGSVTREVEFTSATDFFPILKASEVMAIAASANREQDESASAADAEAERSSTAAEPASSSETSAEAERAKTGAKR